jgi:hypothetical protein
VTANVQVQTAAGFGEASGQDLDVEKKNFKKTVNMLRLSDACKIEGEMRTIPEFARLWN